MTQRLLSDAAYGALKGATAAALAVATPKGSADAFAPLTRVEGRMLRRCADHNDPLFLAIDVAADLDRAAGKPIMASALAQISGGIVVSIAPDPHGRVLHVLKETGEAVAAVASLAQGAWGHGEAKAVRRDVREAMAALASLDLQLTARIEGSE